MNKKEKTLIMVILFVIATLLTIPKVFASNIAETLQPVEYTDEFKEYLNLPKDEQVKRIIPRIYSTPNTQAYSKNPLKVTKRLLKSNLESKYNLKDVIPENISIKNQKDTNSCWAFASLSSLETNLALKNKVNNKTTKVYDFSERHMAYATTRKFANNEINKNSFNRSVGDGGNYLISIPYLTNGTGAINEIDMPFENNEDLIDIAKIKNKTVTSQVYDTVEFPSYSNTEDTTKIKEQIKEHIKKYGSVEACIHGNNILAADYYNNLTGAIYCEDAKKHQPDHDISIIGWDDNYSVENFKEGHKPKNNGAWIIRNSWGEKLEYTIDEIKDEIWKEFQSECIAKGWQDATQIPEDFIKQTYTEQGFSIEGNKVVMKIGDNGFMYVSYEDANIYSQLSGIINASDSVDYENIYQYNYLGYDDCIEVLSSKAYLANIFNKKTSGTEYITKVSLHVPEVYTCKVCVNPNGTSMKKSDLQQVELKSGSTETFDTAGYHTLEFLNPIEIKSNDFVVAIEIQGTRKDSVYISLESPKSNFFGFDDVEIEKGKCFFTVDGDIEKNNWLDLSNLKQENSNLNPGDTTIKAFTVSKVEQKPNENNVSNFDNASCKIEKIVANSKDDKFEMQVQVDGITRNTKEDSKYYYYISKNQDEKNIENWVEIKEKQNESDKLKFTINMNDVKNHKELTDADTLYLYVKEVSTKNEEEKITVSKAMPLKLEEGSNTQVDEKKEQVVIIGSGQQSLADQTLATKILPNTGIRTIVIFIAIIAIVAIVVYARYRNLNKYVK